MVTHQHQTQSGLIGYWMRQKVKNVNRLWAAWKERTEAEYMRWPVEAHQSSGSGQILGWLCRWHHPGRRANMGALGPHTHSLGAPLLRLGHFHTHVGVILVPHNAHYHFPVTILHRLNHCVFIWIFLSISFLCLVFSIVIIQLADLTLIIKYIFFFILFFKFLHLSLWCSHFQGIWVKTSGMRVTSRVLNLEQWYYIKLCLSVPVYVSLLTTSLHSSSCVWVWVSECVSVSQYASVFPF